MPQDVSALRSTLSLAPVIPVIVHDDVSTARDLAEALGGVKVLKAYASPLADITFCPTGGIDMVKAKEYLALPNVICVGGSWVMPADAIASKDWKRIETLAREAAGLKKPA